MQVYANSFRIEGERACSCVLGSIHGWLIQVMGNQFPLSDISRTTEFSGSASTHPRLSCVVSVDETPSFYAWRLVHGEVPFVGRRWIVELGLKADDRGVDFSCAVSTEEQSTLVRSPVSAARPRVVGYILKNLAGSGAKLSNGVPGAQVKRLDGKPHDYYAFMAEIERENRDYPLVLVAPCKDSNYMVNTAKLQEALFGLAQVIEVSPEYDSYEMEEELGKKLSVWDGAINIIRPKRAGQTISNSLLRSAAISEFGQDMAPRISGILARVCHTTNVRMCRDLITPETVTRLGLERKLKQNRSLGEQSHSLAETLQIENEILQDVVASLQEDSRKRQNELDQVEYEKMELEDKLQEAEDKIRTQYYKSAVLQSRPGGQIAAVDLTAIYDIACQQEQPTPEQCLEVTLQAFPNRCEILESAWKSAKEMPQFKNGRRLLDMLRRLMTQYFDAIKTDGDNSARKVFSADEYSAMESETVMRTPNLRDKRVFVRNGDSIEMFRHLKMGKKDNVELTLRVHFAWLASESKIVIGYCGEHLPIASR